MPSKRRVRINNTQEQIDTESDDSVKGTPATVVKRKKTQDRRKRRPSSSSSDDMSAKNNDEIKPKNRTKKRQKTQATSSGSLPIEPSTSTGSGTLNIEPSTSTVLVSPLTLADVQQVVAACLRSGDEVSVLHAISSVFSDIYAVKESFKLSGYHRTLEVDDKKGRQPQGRESGSDDSEDEDSVPSPKSRSAHKHPTRSKDGARRKHPVTCVMTKRPHRSIQLVFDDPEEITVNVDDVREAFRLLFSLPGPVVRKALVEALDALTITLLLELQNAHGFKRDPEGYLNVLVILMELPDIKMRNFSERILPRICHAIILLPTSSQAVLVRFWSRHANNWLCGTVRNIQKAIANNSTEEFLDLEKRIVEDIDLFYLVKTLKLLFYTNLAAGKVLGAMRDDSYITKRTTAKSRASRETTLASTDHLESVLGFRAQDCHKPYLPYTEFYNQTLSETVNPIQEYVLFLNPVRPPPPPLLSFLNYPFLLTPAIKSRCLNMDSTQKMSTYPGLPRLDLGIISFLWCSSPEELHLRLTIRRDHVLEDALSQLQKIASETPKRLKRQLVVEFDNEQGVDSGGLSKEFFQLLIEEIFKKDLKLFFVVPDTRHYWLNPTSRGQEELYRLAGIIMGLAVYNDVIMDVRLPQVFYRKLIGKKAVFEDLEDWSPDLYMGLQNMLNCTENLEEIFLQTFQITYQDASGRSLTQDLSSNGSEIFVTHHNKWDFVDRYSDFLLNSAVAHQFAAFHQGFSLVTDESPLVAFFRPDELEELICGSANYDFDELQESAKYEGFDDDSPTVKDFWSVVHRMSGDNKRRLLQFVTGSDRIPVGGMKHMRFVVMRNGPDTDKLPTAQTCFNTLLLPEYRSKEKLRDRLTKAIENAQGFGLV